jgi:cbb3-type cytochrome c oxidase subunit III
LRRILLAAAAGVAVAFALSGCGTGGLPSAAADKENGKKLFTGKGGCAGCHTLAAAGASGDVGPNLDDSFAQARVDGYKESAIRAIVLEQIKYPGQYPVGRNKLDFLQANMPANLVKGREADDVAAYVAANAGLQGFTEAFTATNGKVIFLKKCGGCHTLKDAGTTGTKGPNLDQLSPPFERVLTQVINGGGAMPAFKGSLTDQQIKAVARYVAEHARK